MSKAEINVRKHFWKYEVGDIVRVKSITNYKYAVVALVLDTDDPDKPYKIKVKTDPLYDGNKKSDNIRWVDVEDVYPDSDFIPDDMEFTIYPGVGSEANVFNLI